ncbi:MAG TPA: TCP-1/cpn60 chaperonin family protein, partial [Rhabdochlamydiaceae bacterium]
LVLETMKDISDLVGATMGPGGKIILLESDHQDISDRASKDGIGVFNAMASQDPYKHSIIGMARACSMRTANEAGDGTTTTAVLANELIKHIFHFCNNNAKESPQKTVRRINKVMNENLLPYIAERSTKVTEENKNLLTAVATVSANGDKELAEAVIKCFEEVGFGEGSHVTIRELPGPSGYKVERIEGFPIPIGLEESSGKYFASFINDQANQRCHLEKPKFILYDGSVLNLNPFSTLLNALAGMSASTENGGTGEPQMIVLVANSFTEEVITTLAFNFEQNASFKIVPIMSPMAQFMNAQTHFLADLAAFTGAKVFGQKNRIDNATFQDLGSGMESFEAFRFRSSLIGEPDGMNIEFRADELKKQKSRAESQAEEGWLEERIAKISSGIAKLTIIGSSPSDIKERADRAEDSVCSIRSSITNGVLPGGCRIALDMANKIAEDLEIGDPAREVLMPALLSLPNRLLDNAGYNSDEASDVLAKLLEDPSLVYDIENQIFGTAEELRLFDATKAVSEALVNAVSIAGILGTLGGIVCHPRDVAFERSEATASSEWDKVSKNPEAYQNPALNRSKS